MNADVIQVNVKKSQAHFRRIRVVDAPDVGVGKYFIVIDITAVSQDVYIPISIASGKKVTGFVYQIEGTEKGSISTTDLSCDGDGVTQVTLGTIVYGKIPVGKTASFRIQIEIRGRVNHFYKIVINCINYKLSPTAARYEKFLKEISTKNLKFK
jgi:hypothetical protein